MNAEQQVLYRLGVALVIGLLIGFERGWKEREAEEGSRIAGVRTFGLMGLLGGVAAMLAESFGALVLGLAFLGLVAVQTTAYAIDSYNDPDGVSITSLVAGLLTFVLGALAGTGQLAVAAAAAVVTTLLLSYKPQLHGWVRALNAEELRAAIKLLLISVVLLPVLPDRGYGPWEALNPYEIWLMVVLIAAISFVGYFAIKIGGAKRGALFTGLFGGLASSTGVTLHFSRLARRQSGIVPVLAAGILLACGTMFPRMLLVASLIQAKLFALLALPSLIMAVTAFAPVFFYWKSQSSRETDTASELRNPLELSAALGFGLLLAMIILLGNALKNQFGEVGVLALAAASGVADVDAITLSLARMSADDLALRTAAVGIVIAAAVNSLVKGGMAFLVGGREIGLRVGLPLLLSSIAGLLTAWLWLWPI